MCAKSIGQLKCLHVYTYISLVTKPSVVSLFLDTDVVCCGSGSTPDL